jgi:hypothetical protein
MLLLRSSNLILSSLHNVHFWLIYSHLCQVVSLQRFCPCHSKKYKSCDSVDKSAQPQHRSTKSCDYMIYKELWTGISPPNISSHHEIPLHYSDQANSLPAGFWSFCLSNLILHWYTHQYYIQASLQAPLLPPEVLGWSPFEALPCQHTPCHSPHHLQEG